MTWQKVVAAKGSKEAQFAVPENGETPEAMGIEPEDGHAAELRLKGLYLKLEAKSGNQYEFSVVDDGTVAIHDMAEDIIEALANGEEVWADVDFDANDGNGRVLYWASGAPWNGGTVNDGYGIYEGV